MRVPDHLKPLMVPIHRAGWPIIAAFALASLLLGLVAEPLFWLGAVVTAWSVYFFRDPPRVTPLGDELVISPADGIVTAVRPRTPPPELELGAQPLPCVSVFMSIFDCHVNRAPVAGTVQRIGYRKGAFVNAALDKASEDNERQCFALHTPTGETFGLVQIAGLVARRIVRFVDEGQSLVAGERIGLIRFGSRCDVYLPAGTTPLVVEGQRAYAGETVLADGRRNAPPRQGRIS